MAPAASDPPHLRFGQQQQQQRRLFVVVAALIVVSAAITYSFYLRGAENVRTHDVFFQDPGFTYQLTREELGRRTWSFLHTMAAHYPEIPTDEERDRIKAFFEAFAPLFPCKKCSKHFQKLLSEFPPRVESGSALSQWLCEAHNIVNKRLGKPEFPCALVAVAWPTKLAGDCGCNDDYDPNDPVEAELIAASVREVSEKQKKATMKPATIVASINAAAPASEGPTIDVLME